MHVRLGNYLKKRRAGTVKVNIAERKLRIVYQLAGVFFQVSARYAYIPGRTIFMGNRDLSVERNRHVILAYLVVFRQIGIVIVLSVELDGLLYIAS